MRNNYGKNHWGDSQCLADTGCGSLLRRQAVTERSVCGIIVLEPYWPFAYLAI